MVWLFLSSGLFLGWSLGANDAANIFGTAVATRMVKFKVAALITSVFIVLGAVYSGAGATHTLGVLGEVNAIGGAFTVALSAALAVTFLIRRGLPVSISQSIVGAIIGWNLFTSSPTDLNSLYSILVSWILNPLLAGLLSFGIYLLLNFIIPKLKVHLLTLDKFYRIAMIFIFVFGAYSLGANNISKVVGVFVSSSPFVDINIAGFQITKLTQLFLVGALSMVVGVFTYSHKTLPTIGKNIYKLSPLSALATLFSASLVLFLFSSEKIKDFLLSAGLPSFPLVPISITQSMFGAVIGIGLAKGGRYINYKTSFKILLGWIITPFSAVVISLVLLFIMQNVFQLKVFSEVSFEFTPEVMEQLGDNGINTEKLNSILNLTFPNQVELRQKLNSLGFKREKDLFVIYDISKIERFKFDSVYVVQRLNPAVFSEKQIAAVKKLHMLEFKHRWEVKKHLSELEPEWQFKPFLPENSYYNAKLLQKYDILFSLTKELQL